MNSNQETNQFGQGSKIDKRHEENSDRHYETEKNIKQYKAGNPQKNDDDFLRGDNKVKYHPNLDQYEMTNEEEDRYNNGTSEHEDFIEEEETKTRYSAPTRNGSHRNHY